MSNESAIKNVFFTSKPIQLINVIAIIIERKISNSSLIIVIDSFSGSQYVSERIIGLGHILPGIRVKWVSSKKLAYSYLHDIKPARIFIDSDVGLKNYASLLKLRLDRFTYKTKICVYEEGLGTYRDDLYHNLKRNMLRIIGAGTYFGGCVLTSYIYLVTPLEYIDLFKGKGAPSVERIAMDPEAMVRIYYDELAQLFGYQHIEVGSHEGCNLYVSGWNLDKNFIRKFRHIDGLNLIKPHPHSKDKSYSGFRCLQAGVPLEVVIHDLLKTSHRVVVYHHGTSCERYISDERVSFININEINL